MLLSSIEAQREQSGELQRRQIATIVDVVEVLLPSITGVQLSWTDVVDALGLHRRQEIVLLVVEGCS